MTRGIAINIQGKTMDVKFLGNTRAESRAPMRRVGRRLGAEVGSLTLKANKLEGFAKPVFDQRR